MLALIGMSWTGRKRGAIVRLRRGMRYLSFVRRLSTSRRLSRTSQTGRLLPDGSRLHATWSNQMGLPKADVQRPGSLWRWRRHIPIPYLDMTSKSFERSSGPPALTIAPTSRKYRVLMSGVRTISARAVPLCSGRPWIIGFGRPGLVAATRCYVRGRGVANAWHRARSQHKVRAHAGGRPRRAAPPANRRTGNGVQRRLRW
jgi:hypothetical protein